MPNYLNPANGGGGGAGTTYEFECDQDDTTSAAWVTLLDITGPGWLYKLAVRTPTAGIAGTVIRLTIDGYVYEVGNTGTGALYIRRHDNPNVAAPFYITSSNVEMDIQYADELIVEFRGDGVNDCHCKCHYAVG